MDKRLFAIPVILLFGLAILFSGLMGGFTEDPTDESIEPEMPSVGEPEFVMQKADSTPAAEPEPEVVVEEAPAPAPTMGGMGGGMSSAPASAAVSTPAPAAADEGTGDEGTGDEGTGDTGFATAADVWSTNGAQAYVVDSWSPAGGPSEECANASRITGMCADYAYKIEWNQTDASANNGVYDDTGAGNITISASTLYAFDWSLESGYKMCQIIVKGGNGAIIYVYDGDTSGSIDVITDPEISHVTFCYTKNGGGTGQEIPEFPTIALPMLAIIGLAFFFNRKQ